LKLKILKLNKEMLVMISTVSAGVSIADAVNKPDEIVNSLRRLILYLEITLEQLKELLND
jgi:hypothetical protein